MLVQKDLNFFLHDRSPRFKTSLGKKDVRFEIQ